MVNDKVPCGFAMLCCCQPSSTPSPQQVVRGFACVCVHACMPGGTSLPFLAPFSCLDPKSLAHRFRWCLCQNSSYCLLLTQFWVRGGPRGPVAGRCMKPLTATSHGDSWWQSLGLAHCSLSWQLLALGPAGLHGILCYGRALQPHCTRHGIGTSEMGLALKRPHVT